MLHFCTLFDSNYLAKGLALVNSLNRQEDKFVIYLLAMNNDAFDVIKTLKQPNVELISLSELEKYKPELLVDKQKKNAGEYSWTCKGPLIQYCFDNYNIDECAYLDADLYFFDKPSLLYTNVGKNDVLLTPHRYSKGYESLINNGYYCAGFIWFKNSTEGRKILDWWTDLCIDWCYGNVEEERFGDQKYLDKMKKKYETVGEIEDNRVNVAPWNVVGFQTKNKIGGGTIFYHFHFFRNTNLGICNELQLGPYKFGRLVKKWIYSPYLEENKIIVQQVKRTGYPKDIMGSKKLELSLIRRFVHLIIHIFDDNRLFWR